MYTNPSIKKQFIVASLIILTIGIVVFSLLLIFSAITVISPIDLTRTRLFVLELRICNYVKQNGRMPRTLHDLPDVKGKDNSIQDGWGREITFEIQGNKIKLISYGRYGSKGGDGKNSDIEHQFICHTGE